MTAEEYLKEHGINEASIKKFGLDWNKDKITIPVKDFEDNIIYNKYRHLDFDKENPLTKKFSFDPGSETTIYNFPALENNYVFIVEGEPDCIRLDQEGISAVTNTAGAMTWKEEWNPFFAGKRIFICMDSDEAGKKATEKLLEQLPAALVISLPPDIKDICEFFQKYSLKEFRALTNEAIKQNNISYQQLCEVVDKWLLLPDKNVLKIIMATLVAHHFTTDPLWLLLIAPPSGTKTELLMATSGLSFIYFISDLTPQTLASGLNYKVDPSLLMKLKNEILVMKDFTTVLSMRQEERQVILSQLREVYDGRYIKEFGTGKRVDWEGRLGFMAGVTTIIDTHSSLSQVMGERFIQYRIPQPDDEEVSMMALKNAGREKEMRMELKIAFRKFFTNIKIPSAIEIEIPLDIMKALTALCSFTVIARSGIIRNNYTKQIDYIPEPEAPSRFTKQIGTLLKAICIVEGRKTVTWNDFYLVLRVAMDAIPRNRMIHILSLCNVEFTKTTTEVAQDTEYSREGSERILEDLTALKLITVTRHGSGQANEWRLSDKALGYFKKMLPKNPKALDIMFPEKDYYIPLIQQITGITAEEEQTDELSL